MNEISFMTLVRLAEVKLTEKVNSFSQAKGQGHVEKRKYFFEEADQEVSYGLFVPESYDGSTQAPLIVLLHGSHSTPHEIIRLRGIVAEANARGYIVVAPYGYDSNSWYGIKDISYVQNNISDLSEKDVMNVLSIVKEDFAIDNNRVYLMGHSMGGAGTLHLGSAYSNLWAAIAPMSPPIFEVPSKAFKKLPVMMVAGQSDRITPVEPIRAWVAEARHLGVECEYEEIKRGTHLFVVDKPEVYTKVFDFFDVHVRSSL
jgi:poly(3-hydroxybutyrate) depolymerase